MFEKEISELRDWLGRLVDVEHDRLVVERERLEVEKLNRTERGDWIRRLESGELLKILREQMRESDPPSKFGRGLMAPLNVAELRTGQCFVCGCDETHPCITELHDRKTTVPCSWANASHTLCSACAVVLNVVASPS